MSCKLGEALARFGPGENTVPQEDRLHTLLPCWAPSKHGQFWGSEGVPGWRVGATGIEGFFISKLERLPGGGAAGIENSSKNGRGGQATSPVGQQLLATVPGGSRAAHPCTTRDCLESKNNFQVRPHTSKLCITGSAGTTWNPQTISRYGHKPKHHFITGPAGTAWNPQLIPKYGHKRKHYVFSNL